MAFPSDLIAEIAFDNNLSESEYAATGWTDVTAFVTKVEGTRRGTDYELSDPQAGSMSISLDNADGRFTPGRPASPYYPNVKSNRKFRLRGKNMCPLNIARTGGQEHSAQDFYQDPGTLTRLVNTPAFDPVNAEDYWANSGALTIAATKDAEGGLEVQKVTASTWLAWQLDFGTQTATSMEVRCSSQPGCTIQLRADSQTGTVLGSATVPAGSFNTYNTFTISGLSLTGAHTMYLTFTGTGDDVVHLVHLQFYRGTQLVARPVAVQHDPVALGFTGQLAEDTEGWHIAATLRQSLPAGDIPIFAWDAPVDLGSRLTHSAWFWRTGDADAVGDTYSFEIRYYDADDNLLDTDSTLWDPPFPTSPTRYAVTSLPPSDTAHAVGALVLHAAAASTNTTRSFAVCGIQTELPVNLAPNVSGGTSLVGWSGGATFAQTGIANLFPGSISTITETWANLSNWGTFGSPSVSSGTLQLPTGTAGAYSAVLSHQRVATGSGFSAAVSAPGSLAAGAEFYATLFVDANNSASFIASGASWVCRVRQGGVNTDYTVTAAHPSLPAWICVREADGKVYWQTSTDGTTWTDLYSTTHTANFNVCAIQFQAGSYSATTPMNITVSELNTHNPQPAVTATWTATGTEVRQSIPRLVPGETYTASARVRKSSGSLDVLMTADDGLTGATLSTDNTWTTLTTTWTALQVSEPIKFQIPSTASGKTVEIKQLTVVQTSGPVTPESPTDTGVTDWQRPKPIFEGWIDAWPVTTTAAITEDVQVTVNDRLVKLANIGLDEPLLEELYVDKAGLVLPLNDPSNSAGTMSNLGAWADWLKVSSFDITPTRGDVAGASFSLGTTAGIFDNETALTLTPADATHGYLIVLPYSKDYKYAPTLPPPTSPPSSTPGDDGSDNGSTGGSQTYTATYYATWSRSYTGTGSTRSNDPTICYQGDSGADTQGNQKSLIGFNHATIAADMAGVTVTRVLLNVNVEHTWYSSGATLLVGTHNSATKPGSWPGGINSHIWGQVVRTGWQTIPLEVSFVTNIINGTVKGIAIGPGTTSSRNYYLYLGGIASSARAYLTIEYQM